MPLLRPNAAINPSVNAENRASITALCLTCHNGAGSQKDISRQVAKTYTMNIGGKVDYATAVSDPTNTSKIGSWSGSESGGYYTTDGSASFTYRFTGTGITLISRKDYSAGTAEVTLKDGLGRTVDQSNISTTGVLLNAEWTPVETAVYTKSDLAPGSYSVSVKIAAGSPNQKIWVRGFRVHNKDQRIHSRNRGEFNSAELYAGTSSNRHVECTDCHNPHQDKGPPHTFGTNVASTIQNGVWGVSVQQVVSGGSTPPVAKIRQVKFEYQLCFRCHTYYASPGTAPLDLKGRRQADKSVDFNRNNASFHPVEGPGRNLGIEDSSFVEGTPMNPTSGNDPETGIDGPIITCSDCHGSEEQTKGTTGQWFSDWNGPHGSNNPFILKKPFSWNLSDVTSGNYLCLLCHKQSVYVGGAGNESRGRDAHGDGQHSSFRMCQSCHTPHGRSNLPHLINGESIMSFTHDRDGGSCGPACHSGVAAWGMRYTIPYPHACGPNDNGSYRRFEQGGLASSPFSGEVQCSFTSQDPTNNGWTTISNGSASGGSFAQTTGTGSGYFTFVANKLQILATLSPSYPGTADVYVDGVLKGSYNTNSGTTKYQQAVFSLEGLNLNRHTLRIAGKAQGAVNYDAVEFSQNDTNPPATITDLDSQELRDPGIRLAWTSPGDNAWQGQAATYDVRYSTTPITDDASYAAAAQVTGEPTPMLGGNTQQMDVGGLSPSTKYWLVVKTADNEGNWSAPSNASIMTTGPSADLAGPPVPPRAVYASGRNAEVRLSWNRNEELDLAGYNIYEATGLSGPYSKVNGAPVSTSYYEIPGRTNGVTYYYVVKAVDSDTNESVSSDAASASPTANSPARTEETGSGMVVPAMWTSVTDASASGGAYKQGSILGAYAEFTFSGSQVALAARKHSSAGKFKVYVDQVFFDEIDLYDPATGYQKLVFKASGLSLEAAHKIRIFPLVKSNARSSGFTINLDAIDVFSGDPPAAPSYLYATGGDGQVELSWNHNTESDLSGYNIYEAASPGGPYAKLNGTPVTDPYYTVSGGTNGETYYYVVRAEDSASYESVNSTEAKAAPSAISPARFEESSADVTYTGTWTPLADAGASAGNYRWSTTGGSTATFRFYGDNLTWRALKRNNAGQAFVFIDGYFRGMVDLYTPGAIKYQAPVFSTFSLSPGNHQAEILVAGTKQSSSSGTVVNADAFDVWDDGTPDPPKMLSATPANGSVTLSWNAGRESDIAGYNIYEARKSSGPYVKINGAATTDTWYQTAGKTNGNTYYYTVTAVDASGNESGFSRRADVMPTSIAPAIYQETSSKITYGGTWTSTADASASGGNYKYSSTWGKTATISRESDGSLYWITKKGPNRGTARIHVDQVYAGEVDLYNPANRYQVPVFTAWMTKGIHSLKLDVIGDRHPLSSGNTVDVDAFGLIQTDRTSGAMVSQMYAAARNSEVGLSWNATTAEDFDHYEIYRTQSPDTGWSLLTTATVPAYSDTSVTNGQTYYYRVAAIDTSGNRSFYSDNASATPSNRNIIRIEGESIYPATVQDSSSSIIYSEGWSAYTSTGTARRNDVTSQRASFTFTGSKIEYYAFKWDDAGKANIYVDGVYQTQVDLYVGSYEPTEASLVYSKDNLSNHRHTIDVEVAGTKNASSSDYYVYVDYFGLPDLSSGWSKSTDSSESAGAGVRVPTVNQYAKYRFYGPEFTWLATKAPSFGYVTVYVDKARLQTFDLYSPQTIYQVPLFTVSGLATADHEVYIEALGKRNPISTGNTVDVDAIDYPSADTTAPAAPTSLYATASDDSTVAVSWNASRDQDVSGYLVYRSDTPGGPYSLIAGPVNRTYQIDTGLTTGQPYYYAVKSRDTSTNDSAYSTEAGATPDAAAKTRLEAETSTTVEDNSAIIYSEGWSAYTSTGTARRNDVTSQRASFTFTGSRIDYLAFKWDNAGKVNIYVDGVYQTQVDLYVGSYNPTEAVNVFTKSNLPYGQHTIEVEVSGSKNASSSDYYVYVDKFTYWEASPSGWYQGTSWSGRSNTAAAYGYSIGTYTYFYPFATELSLIGTKATSRGSADIYVDGVFQDTIDTYSGSTGYQLPVYTKRGLADGYHSIKVVVGDDKHPAATSYYVEADAFDYLPATDTTPPSAPDSLYATASGDSTVALSWNASREEDVSGYLVYRGDAPGGPYTQLTTPDSVNRTYYIDTGLTPDAPFYYVVKSRDDSGNDSGYSTEAGATPDAAAKTRLEAETSTTVEDNSASIIYSDTWSAYTSTGTARRNKVTSQRASFTFTGSRIDYLAFKWDNAGKVNIYVDGVYQTQVDLYVNSYNPTEAVNVYTKSNLPYGRHTIEVEVSGLKNASSSDYYVYVDKFTYWEASPSGWYQGTSWSGRSNTAAAYGYSIGTYTYFYPFATELSLIGTKATSRGSADIYVDGVFQDTIDTYSGSTGYQLPVYTKRGLADGYHSIKVVVDENKHPAATSYYVEADAFDYVPAADTTAPAAPTSLYATASGDSTVALSWNASREEDVSGYLVYRSDTPGGPYSLIAGPVNRTYQVDSGLTPDAPYYYVVKARDTSANDSADSSETGATPDTTTVTRIETEATATVQENSASIIYSYGWSNYASGGYNAYINNTTNQRASYTFTGSKIEYYGFKRSDGGISYIYVDGVYQGSADHYRSATNYGNLLYQSGALTYGRHTIDVMITSTKNASSSGYYALVDYFAVDASYYSGTWSTTANAVYSGGATYYSSQIGAYVYISPPTTYLALIGAKSTGRGSADVFIDAVLQDTIDIYSGSTGYQIPLFSRGGLAAAPHTLKVTVDENKHPNSTSFTIDADAYEYKTPADTSAPAAPTSLYATASGDSTVALSWNASREEDVTGYLIYRSDTPGGPYSLIAGPVNRTYQIDSGLTPDAPYYYVVKARDSSANDSADSTEAGATPDSSAVTRVEAEATATVQDNSGSVVYSYGWSSWASGGNNAYINNTVNQRASYTFTGSKIEYYGFKRSDGGISYIYVDGVYQGSADHYAGSVTYGNLLYQSGALTYGRHTIDVMVTNTKNASSSGYYALVDYFMVDASYYSGTWNTTSNAVYSGGATYYSNRIDSYEYFSAPTNFLSLIASKGTGRGSADIYVDAVLQDTISLYSGSAGYQVPVYSKGGLSSIAHSLRVTVDENKHPLATAFTVDADAYDYKIPADTAAPAAPTPLYATASGDSTVALSWNASQSDDVSGYLVFRGDAPGGPYEQLTTPDAVNRTFYIDSGLTTDAPFYYRVKARDASSNDSAYSNEAGATPDSSAVTRVEAEATAIVQDNSGSVVYSYGWSSWASGGNNAYINNTLSQRASYTFTGSKIEYYGFKRSDGGISYIYVDGVYQGSADHYAGSVTYGNLLYQSGALTYGRHTIDVVVTSTKNASSSGYYALVDYFAVDDSYYSGTWSTTSNAVYSGGATYYSNQIGGYVYFSPPTTYLALIGAKSTGRGSADIYIDNVLINTINAYSPATGYQIPLFSKSGLSETAHTLKVTVDENKHPSATAFTIDVDAYEYKVPADTAAPAAPTPLYATASGDTTVALSWNASLSEDVSGYLVFRGDAPGGPYEQLTTPDAVNRTFYIDSGLTTDAPFYYRVKARDTSSNDSAYSNEFGATPDGSAVTRVEAEATTTIQDNSGSVIYSYGWSSYPSGGNNAYINNTVNQRASYTFTGSKIEYYGFKRSDGGISYIYVDGVYQGSADHYAGSVTYGNLLYQSGALTYGRHTIDVMVTNTKNASSSGYYALVDYFAVDDSWYSGNWYSTSGGAFSAGATFYSTQIGGYAYLKSLSDAISVASTKGPQRGSADIYIDGVLQNTVNLYSAAWGFQVPVFSKRNLAPGLHWIQAYVDENKHPLSTSFFIDIDAYDYKIPPDTAAPPAPTSFYATASDDSAVVLSWNAVQSEDVEGYLVHRAEVPGGPYEQITTPDAIDQTWYRDTGLTTDTRYYYVVQARDTSSNDSAYSAERNATPDATPAARTEAEPFTLDEQDSGNITYTGTWNNYTSGTTAKRSNITNNRAAFSFTGQQVQYYAFKNSDAGEAKIYIDSVLQTTVDLYRSSIQTGVLMYTKSDLDEGAHSIWVDVAGTKNASSSGTYVYVDYFYNYVTSRTGIWGTSAWGGRSNDSSLYSYYLGGTAYDWFSFTGNEVSLISTKHAQRGSADIYIDGVYATTINAYSTTSANQIPVYAKRALGPGVHNIKVYSDENKDPESTHYYFEVDAFDVTP